MSGDTKERLRAVLVRLGAPAGRVQRLGAGDDLVEHGLLDSVAAIGLVSAVEKEFGVRVPTTEMSLANFNTLAAMERLLSRLQRDRR